MREKLFKLFFKREYNLLKFYEREYQINTCSASVEGFKMVLPNEVEGYKLDMENLAYRDKETGAPFISVAKHTNRNKAQNLACLYFELRDRGYIT